MGCFVVGSVALDYKSPVAGIFNLDGNRTECLTEGFVITNGLCWSPDDDKFYIAGSGPKTIYTYDYDLERGTVAKKRIFAETGSIGGLPDGATDDRDGRLWSAICAAGKIVCWNLDGSVAEVVEMPAKLVTSVMFGGPELDILYVTSLDGVAANAAELGIGADPLGGYLSAVTGLGAKGVPEP